MWITKLRPILGYGLNSRQILLRNRVKCNMLAALPLTKYNNQRTYKNFGHQNDPPEHPLKKCYLLAFMGLMIYYFINWDA